MGKRVRTAALLTLLPAASCAQTVPVSRAERVCALPEVVRGVVLELQNRGVAGEVDARNPGEVTSPDGSGARCSVWLIRPAYNTNLPGSQPRYDVVVQMYQVRRLPHSLAVDLTE